MLAAKESTWILISFSDRQLLIVLFTGEGVGESRDLTAGAAIVRDQDDRAATSIAKMLEESVRGDPGVLRITSAGYGEAVQRDSNNPLAAWRGLIFLQDGSRRSHCRRLVEWAVLHIFELALWRALLAPESPRPLAGFQFGDQLIPQRVEADEAEAV